MSQQILVIEDDEAIRQAIAFKLQKEGFEVKTAGDGIGGLNVLRANNTLTLVLLDLRMPSGDGFWFLEQKKSDLAIANIPVVVFTNLTDKQYTDKSKLLGIKGYIIKAQHSVQDIVDEVKKCLRGEPCLMEGT